MGDTSSVQSFGGWINHQRIPAPDEEHLTNGDIDRCNEYSLGGIDLSSGLVYYFQDIPHLFHCSRNNNEPVTSFPSCSDAIAIIGCPNQDYASPCAAFDLPIREPQTNFAPLEELTQYPNLTEGIFVSQLADFK
ncbi:hypothetical protein HYW76_04750 [Candidatus Pacearchaeota archaeon]|nr:hypothetical protein [Candidatus Pacearchaeota archaeon]